MDEIIKNASGEKIDYSFHPGSEKNFYLSLNLGDDQNYTALEFRIDLTVNDECISLKLSDQIHTK